MERERVVTWEDPMPGAAAAKKLSGLEYLQKMMDGKLPGPPISHTLGVYPHELAEGRVVFKMTPAEFHYNPIGGVHGGVISTICDSAMGCAVHSTLPAGSGYTSLDLKVNFLKAVTIKVGELYCEGTVIHSGGRIVLAEARLTDADGTLYAHSTSTCMVIRPSGDGKKS